MGKRPKLLLKGAAVHVPTGLSLFFIPVRGRDSPSFSFPCVAASLQRMESGTVSLALSGHAPPL